MIRRRFLGTLALGLSLAGAVLTVQGFAPSHDPQPVQPTAPSSPARPLPEHVDGA